MSENASKEHPEEVAQPQIGYDYMCIRHAGKKGRDSRMDIEYVSEQDIDRMVQEYCQHRCIEVPSDNVNVYVYCDKAEIAQKCKCGSPG